MSTLVNCGMHSMFALQRVDAINVIDTAVLSSPNHQKVLSVW